MSSWIIVFYSLERCLAVWRPLRLAACDSSRKRAIGGLFVVAFMFEVKTLVLYESFEHYNGARSCFYSPRLLTKTGKLSLAVTDMTLNSTIPCILVIALNVVTFFGIRRQREDTVLPGVSRGLRSRAGGRCARNSMLISILFVVACAPSIAMWTYYNYQDIRGRSTMALYRWAAFTESLMILNYAFNFVIYIASFHFYMRTIRRCIEDACCRTEYSLTGRKRASSERIPLPIIA